MERDEANFENEKLTTISKMAEAHLIHVRNEIQQKDSQIEQLQAEKEELLSYFDEKLELLKDFQVWNDQRGHQTNI